jgi:CheY-like chemotaxis protein
LLVTDDEPLCKELIGFLEPKGWEVLRAGTGREALGLWEAIAPDVALVDLDGDEADAFAFLSGARRLVPRARAVVCSADPRAATPPLAFWRNLGVESVVLGTRKRLEAILAALGQAVEAV